MGENQNTHFVEKRQKRLSEIRLPAVHPPPLYYLQKLQKHRTNSALMGENENANFVEKVKIDPQEYVYQGSPPPSPWECEIHSQMMTSVYSIWYIDFDRRKERMLFWWAKIKTRALSKNVKIDPQEYVYQGSPLPLLSTKLHKHRRNSVLMGESYNANFGKICQKRTSGIHLSGVRPPCAINKNS